MHVEAIFPALRAGKRARRESWPEGQYVRQEGDRYRMGRNACNEDERTMTWFGHDMNATDWEVQP